ncbi:MAG: GtrA family protein [Comamonadaceae bacterium]|nr:GtrA family protein [Comamonadaceae bacterium]
MRLLIIYSVLALLATVVNIGTQDLVIRGYQGAFNILVSVLVGTVAGLIVKYSLDKRFVFGFHAIDAAHDRKTFTMYTLMGLATTVIFWVFEFGFDHVFKTKEMRYLGGCLGLAIGYCAKYQLDKRYVFLVDGS